MPKLLLKISNLKTYFGSGESTVKAVDDISFSIFEGETLGVVGESGSGKSVTALSILRLLGENVASYPSGEIEFNGKNLLSLPEKELRKIRGKDISIIFQNPMTSLNPSHRCGNQVREAILIHQDVSKQQAKQQVLELFEMVDLPDPERIYNSYPHQLSGGQIQRIMIAMAVANKPKLIIADEPTTALDVTVQKKIIELLLRLKDNFGCAIMFISHDLGLVNQIADHVAVMRKGRIVESGSVKQIFSKPKHPYTRGLIACKPPIDYRLSRLATVSQFMDDPDFRLSDFIDKYKLNKEKISDRLSHLSAEENILEVNNLKKWYPSKTNFFGRILAYTKAVDDLSFSVKKGETLGLVGESGSGKSTLGMTILRLLDHNGGSVMFNGKSVFDLNSKDLKEIRKDYQIIFQNPYASLNPRMRIGAAISEPMQVHNIHDKRDRKDKTIELLELVGLEADHYYRYPHQFSGGQRQRISIARTLAVEPKFIVCDECVSALDVSIQAQILNLLTDLRDKFGLTYIFISHDLSVVKHISDRILVMKSGKIVERGVTQNIFENPQQKYTQSLLDAIPN